MINVQRLTGRYRRSAFQLSEYLTVPPPVLVEPVSGLLLLVESLYVGTSYDSAPFEPPSFPFQDVAKRQNPLRRNILRFAPIRLILKGQSLVNSLVHSYLSMFSA